MGKKKRVLNVRKKTLQLSDAKKSEGTATALVHYGAQCSCRQRSIVGYVHVHESGQTVYRTPASVRAGLSAWSLASVLVRHVRVRVQTTYHSLVYSGHGFMCVYFMTT